MIIHHQQIKKWIFNPAAIFLTTAMIIAYSPKFLSINASVTNRASASEITSSEPLTPKLVAQNQAIYRNTRFGFEFKYLLKDFVVKVAKTTTKNNTSPLAVIDIWTQKHAQEIRAGAYEGGAEYPANVQVIVYRNPQKLRLLQWIEQSKQFVVTSKFKYTKIARQNALQFQSSGLYEHQNLAFVNPKDSNIIVLTISRTGGNSDATYQRAYEQLVRSFTFNRGNIN
jgi:hypothetical protein